MPEHTESYEQMVERETAELESQPQPLSQSAIDQEIEAIRNHPDYRSPDAMKRAALVDRMMALTSGQPVLSKPSKDNPEASPVPDNVFDQLEPPAQELVRAEATLRGVWGASTEQRLAEIGEWVEGLDARLGGDGRSFSTLLESSGLSNDVGLAKVVSEALRGADRVALSPSEASSLKDKLHQLALRKDLNPALRDAVVEGLHELSRVVYGDDGGADEGKGRLDFDAMKPKAKMTPDAWRQFNRR